MKGVAWKNRLLILSLLTNLLFLIGTAWVIDRKGGIKYLSNYRAILRGSEVSIESFGPTYQFRYSEHWGEPVKRGATIFVGDSLTEQGKWREWFPKEVVLNRGIGADTTVGVRFRLKEILRHEPKRIFLMIGIADLRMGREPKRIVEEMAKILRTIEESARKVSIVLVSILPIHEELFGYEISNREIIEVNEGYRNLALSFRVQFLDLSKDFMDPNGQLKREWTNEGVHLNDWGYQIWREAVAKALEAQAR